MPRSGTPGTYTLPPNTDNQVPLGTISSAMFNAFADDVEQTFNTPTPIAYGGTNAATAIGGIDSLTTKGADIATAATLNLDTATGQFVDLTGTTTVTAVTLAEGRHRMTRAAGNFQITVGASLIGNGGSNASVKAGDLIFWEGYSGGIVRFWIVRAVNLGATLVDVRRNHDVNGDIRDSQENGNTTSTANAFYPADQWAVYRVTSAGVITVGRVDAVTPAGGTKRIRITISTADASLAAGEYLVLSQNLEGSNVADHKYGAAGAFASVRRFGFRSSIPITIGFSRQNSAANRSWVGTSVVAANTDTVQEFAIPGDTTGTWLTADGVIGFTENIVLAAGSTFQGATGWQNGNIYGTSAVTNGMGTVGAVFEIFDTGERLDPDATGVYGQYEVGVVDSVYRSERYYEKSYDPSVALGSATQVGAVMANMGGTGGAPGKAGSVLIFQKAKSGGTLSYWDLGGNASRFTLIDSANTLSNNQNVTLTTNIGSKNFNYLFSNALQGHSFQWAIATRLS